MIVSVEVSVRHNDNAKAHHGAVRPQEILTRDGVAIARQSRRHLPLPGRENACPAR